MSDDTDSNVVHLPTRGSDSGGMPDAPDGGDLFYSEPPASNAGSTAPPESPQETTMELPAIREPISPEVALQETGIPDAPDIGGDESGVGEYVQPRSLADRLGDWLELRLQMARDRQAGEAPFREAEIARKVKLLEARTAQETAMMEQNAKLQAAQAKAKSDKTAARGKADAAQSSSSGMGADKGRSKAGGGGGPRGGGGGGSSGGSGRGSGGGRGAGPNGSGSSGRGTGGGSSKGSGGGSSPKGAGKGSDRSAGGRGGGTKGNESSGGGKGRQNGSGGSGSGKAGTGKGSSGGSGGKNGSGSTGGGKGGSKGDGGTSKDSPAVSPRAERARGRQERAAARQAARHQRRSADQAASLADRSKDRDQDRVADQAAREERRRAKAERRAARQARREAAKTADDRITLGAALGKEAQRRWDKRRAAEKDKAEKDGKAKDGAGDTKDGAGDTKDTGDKDSEATKNGPDPASGTAGQGQKSEDQADEQSPGKGPGSADSKDGSDSSKGAWGWWKKKPETDPAGPDGDEPRSAAGSRTQQGDGPYEDLFGREDPQYTTDRPDRPDTEPGRRPDAAPGTGADDDVVDAVIVEDPGDPFGADRVRQPGITTGAPGLPPAPERHTQRPGTSRPTAQEDPVASQVSKPATGQARMAAKHRTDITFGEYLTEIVNIAIAAGADKDRAQELAGALGKVADALRDMAADLVGDHNIATTVVDQITDLADAAFRMKMLAERCATECEIASEAALLAATAVGWTYSADMQAMDGAGLADASSAAHHD